MSVLSPKRVILFVVASLLALPLLANHPSPRLQAKMAFDEQARVGVLFGGRGLDDGATGLVHANDETWVWIRDQWIQQFPATRPQARSAHSMTYDSQRGRVLLFGGRLESTELRGRFGLAGDTWAWKNGEWQQIDTGAAPPARYYADMTYDRARDRVLLFGGYHYGADGKTLETLHDTWEFDGETWTEVQATAAGPDVDKPLLAYHIARKETILVGVDDELATATYRWDPSGKTWQSVAGETKPPCANEASLSYQTHNERLVFTGGVCGTSTGLIDEVWEFDDATWTKIGGTLNGLGMTRTGGSAYAYDTVLHRLVRYGGTSNFNTFIESSTNVYADGRWQVLVAPTRPDPRSLTTFRRDPVRGTIWLFGGLSEFSYGTTIDYTSDLWRYDADGWHSVKFTTGRTVTGG